MEPAEVVEVPTLVSNVGFCTFENSAESKWLLPDLDVKERLGEEDSCFACSTGGNGRLGLGDRWWT